MDLRLLCCGRMKTAASLIALVIALAVAPCARAQDPEAPDGTPIQSAQVSGFDTDRLSPGLQRDLDALAGRSLDHAYLNELASRIEAERPEVVAAVRAVVGPDGNARVVFFVARISDDRSLTENINARYLVERVDVEGLAETELSAALRADMQLMVGTRLDHDVAEGIAKRIRDELPGYDVTRRVSRGTKPGQIKVVFEIRRGEGLRWIHFAPSRTKYLYHSDQGWSGLQDIPLGNRDIRATVGFAIDNKDDLIEEYSGYEFRIESRKVGTERVGVGLDLSWLHQEWEDSTIALAALNPQIPEPYRVRSTVAPWGTFAFNRHFRASAGVSIAELESLSHSPASESANAFVIAAGYDQEWKRPADRGGADLRQRVDATVSIRSGTDLLESDLIYKRYFGNGNYRLSWGKQELLASFMAGGNTGRAPLFERFSLGDSSTLRGWDKYDIAPAGGDRMFHTSAEYRNRGLAFFVDTGSVWDRDADSKVRVSTGVGYHTDNFFSTLAFPVNTDDVRTVFMIGVRF
jgi:hypothetical protein